MSEIFTVRCIDCHQVIPATSNRFDVGPNGAVQCWSCWKDASDKVDPRKQPPTPTTGLQTPIEESYTAIPPLALHEMARYFLHRHLYHYNDTLKEYHRPAKIVTSEAIKHQVKHDNIRTLIRSAYYSLLALEIEIVGQCNVKITEYKDVNRLYKGDDECNYALIPPHALQKVACVMASGTRKYGPRNWDNISVAGHLDHAIRHGYLYIMGDTIDEPTGIDHLAHMACRALMALEVEMLKQQPNNEIADTDTVLQVLQKKAIQ